MQKVSPLYVAMTPESEQTKPYETLKESVAQNNGNYSFSKNITEIGPSSNIDGNTSQQNFRLENGILVPNLRTPSGRLIRLIGWPEENKPSKVDETK